LYDALATLRVGHALWQRPQRRALDPNRLLRHGVFNERSAAFLLQVAVLRAFAEAALEPNAVPAVILLPDRTSLASVRWCPGGVYAPLEAALLKVGIDAGDAADAFRSAPGTVDELFAPGGHYSPTGNRVLAEWPRGILAHTGSHRSWGRSAPAVTVTACPASVRARERGGRFGACHWCSRAQNDR